MDYTPIEDLIEEAEHIFIGYVVEINYKEFERHIEKSYKDSPYEMGEEGLIYIGSVEYEYRSLPIKIFKQTSEVPMYVSGGYCQGAQVEGTGKYIIMTYKYEDSDGFGSKAWSADNPYFKELEKKLYEKFETK
ncbi:hypothetical protein GCM10011356_18990 [Kangiella profundi]|nr:hypothetical protein GCM10011356_18990 [Kangiella profundi]